MDTKAKWYWKVVQEQGMPDPDFDDQHTAVTVQFPLMGGLTAGEMQGYATGWHRVAGDRFDAPRDRR